MLTSGERLAVMSIARSAAKTAQFWMRYLEFKKRNKPTDVYALQPGSLCDVYREKSPVFIRSGKVGGLSVPYVYLGRRGSVAVVKIWRRL